MQIYGFEDKLTRSRIRQATDISALKRAFPKSTSIRIGTEAEDRSGADYVVSLPGGSVTVDVKARERGCSRYWKNGPELAIELWSKHGSRTGWALDWSKKTDYLMFTFDPEDHAFCYIIPALAIRQLTERYEDHIRDLCKTATQRSDGWTSECAFISINDVGKGITASWKFLYMPSAIENEVA